jgi:RNA-binding protein 8A
MADTTMEVDPPSTSSSLDPAPVRSIEGWILLALSIHEEASEEDLHELFGEYGTVKQLHMNLDRRTGYVKGYALIEYATHQEAEEAIKGVDGREVLGQKVRVGWAFVRPDGESTAKGAGDGKSGGKGVKGKGGRTVRDRSRSPAEEVREKKVEGEGEGDD